jgi:hypothetical protein
VSVDGVAVLLRTRADSVILLCSRTLLGRAPQPPLPRGGLRCATGAALGFRRGLLPPRLVVASELTLGATAHGGRGGTGVRSSRVVNAGLQASARG